MAGKTSSGDCGAVSRGFHVAGRVWNRGPVSNDPSLCSWHGGVYTGFIEEGRGIIGVDTKISCAHGKNTEFSPVFTDMYSGHSYQIFIKSPIGPSTLVWVDALDAMESLHLSIARQIGIPVPSFYLLHEGILLYGEHRLVDKKIIRNSTISLQFRLRGGSAGYRGTATARSYKDAARNLGSGPSAPTSSLPCPYIVEKLDSTPTLEIKHTEVTQHFISYSTHAVICRFNGFWPKSNDLHNWIIENWTEHGTIHLCSKGFFIALFENLEDREKVLTQGPWFWGRAGLFVTPWFPGFDANTFVVSKLPVWVRLPNLPISFWHDEVLMDIGNLLGKFIKIDHSRRERGLFDYARICVEIDLSIGLPDKIQLKSGLFTWLQQLDFENTAFRCRFCHKAGHLQDFCPLSPMPSKRNKGTKKIKTNGERTMYLP